MQKQKQRDLLGLSIEELTELAATLGQKSYRARQLWEGIYRQWVSSVQQISTLPIEIRDRLVSEGREVGLPEIEKKFVSVDGTVRYLIRFADGQSVETVWMPEGDGGLEAGNSDDDSSADSDESKSGTPPAAKKSFHRATICVSSQIGCAVNCKFCMTALLGVQRNLTAGEIVGQILVVLNDHAIEMKNERVNLVFMGQGEPFLNYENFMDAVRLLVEAVQIPASRMTVSTSGIVPRIADFAKEPVRPRLAISLNGSNDQDRTRVMPINKKWDLAQLISAAREFPLRGRDYIFFEYVLLDGVNDSIENAREVVELLRGLKAKVNLIALNPGPEIPFGEPDRERVLAFQQVLIKAGIRTHIRRPRGRDIYAACGQLKKTMELVKLG